MVGVFGVAASPSSAICRMCLLRLALVAHAVGRVAVPITAAIAALSISPDGMSSLVSARFLVPRRGKHGAPKQPAGAGGNSAHCPSAALIPGHAGPSAASAISGSSIPSQGNTNTVHLTKGPLEPLDALSRCATVLIRNLPIPTLSRFATSEERLPETKSKFRLSCSINSSCSLIPHLKN